MAAPVLQPESICCGLPKHPRGLGCQSEPRRPGPLPQRRTSHGLEESFAKFAVPRPNDIGHSQSHFKATSGFAFLNESGRFRIRSGGSTSSRRRRFTRRRSRGRPAERSASLRGLFGRTRIAPIRSVCALACAGVSPSLRLHERNGGEVARIVVPRAVLLSGPPTFGGRGGSPALVLLLFGLRTVIRPPARMPGGVAG